MNQLLNSWFGVVTMRISGLYASNDSAALLNVACRYGESVSHTQSTGQSVDQVVVRGEIRRMSATHWEEVFDDLRRDDRMDALECIVVNVERSFVELKCQFVPSLLVVN